MSVFINTAVIYLVCSFGMLLSFQNCAKVKFSQKDSASLSANSFCESSPTAAECVTAPASICTFNGKRLAESASVVAYQNSSVLAGQLCVAEIRTCKNGALTGSYSFATCDPGIARGCLFNGLTLPDGGEVLAYTNSNVPAASVCQSENRKCGNGILGGSFLYAKCTVEGFKSCLFNGQTVEHGSAVASYSNSTVPVGSLCIPARRTCYNGILTSGGNFASCAVSAAPACLFNGVTVANGQSVPAFANSTVAFGSSCAQESRVCSGGSLSGTYNFATCSVGAAASCSFNGQSVSNGQTVTGFLNSTVAFGASCSSEPRLCNNGILSGRYQYSTCAAGAVASCMFNGQTVAHSQSVPAFLNSTVASGSACTQESRVCTNGNLSGSFNFSSCNVGAAATCLFDGKSVAHGQDVIGYQNSTVPSGTLCISQQRTCNNGALNGSYQYSTCSVSASASCFFNGQTLASGQKVTAFAASTVPFGQNCLAEERLCLNGNLLGINSFASCSVGATASCTWNGMTIPSGQAVTSFATSSVAFGQSCSSQQSLCTNGTFSSLNQFPSCNVGQPAGCTVSGLNLAHGEARTFFQSSNVPFGSSCSQQVRQCNNGSLPGSYSATSCQVDAEVCTQSETLAATKSYVVQESASVAAIAVACIDQANPALENNLPENSESSYIRFFNTCGNRYCINTLGSGYFDGRVVESTGGVATVQCRRRDPPPTITNACRQKLLVLPKPIDTLYTNENVVADNCIDSINPTRADNLPGTGMRDVRFIFTCAARWCRTQGYSTGRMTENAWGTLAINCYREEVFNQLAVGTLITNQNTTVDGIAQQCVDAAVTTVSGSYPSQGSASFIRFVNTCGNRYCNNLGLGTSGWVTEIGTNSFIEGQRATTVMCNK